MSWPKPSHGSCREKVPVINVSLVGPPNRVLEGVVQRVIAGGHIVVAAVGNDGPAAAPLYPAAWPGVVGVTGVDARRRVLVEAERGAQVKFAAPGAQMAAAKSPSGYTLVRGTSFAAPIVAGLLALNLSDSGQGCCGSRRHGTGARGRGSWVSRSRTRSMGLVWWARRLGVSLCSRRFGQIKLRNKYRARDGRFVASPLVVLLRRVAEWPRPREETTMKTNHLLASAAISAMLVVTLPAHAQILGGGMHGGVGGMQSAPSVVDSAARARLLGV